MLSNQFVSFNIGKLHLKFPESLIFADGSQLKGVVFTEYEQYLLCNFMELPNLSRYLLESASLFSVCIKDIMKIWMGKCFKRMKRNY